MILNAYLDSENPMLVHTVVEFYNICWGRLRHGEAVRMHATPAFLIFSSALAENSLALTMAGC